MRDPPVSSQDRENSAFFRRDGLGPLQSYGFASLRQPDACDAGESVPSATTKVLQLPPEKAVENRISHTAALIKIRVDFNCDV